MSWITKEKLHYQREITCSKLATIKAQHGLETNSKFCQISNLGAFGKSSKRLPTIYYFHKKFSLDVWQDSKYASVNVWNGFKVNPFKINVAII